MLRFLSLSESDIASSLSCGVEKDRDSCFPLLIFGDLRFLTTSAVCDWKVASDVVDDATLDWSAWSGLPRPDAAAMERVLEIGRKWL